MEKIKLQQKKHLWLQYTSVKIIDSQYIHIQKERCWRSTLMLNNISYCEIGVSQSIRYTHLYHQQVSYNLSNLQYRADYGCMSRDYQTIFWSGYGVVLYPDLFCALQQYLQHQPQGNQGGLPDGAYYSIWRAIWGTSQYTSGGGYQPNHTGIRRDHRQIILCPVVRGRTRKMTSLCLTLSNKLDRYIG